MKIAIVDEGLPYHLNAGKPIRAFDLISRLADKHEITYFVQSNADSEFI